MTDRPLDLQIFEKHPDVDAYRFGPSFTPHAIVAQEKRFTDAELAAEYWRANGSTQIRAYKRDVKGNIIDVRGVGWEYEHEVMNRFATLPHYDEQ